MLITEVDPHDVQAFDRWHACYVAAERFGRGDHAGEYLLEESRALKRSATRSSAWRVWSGIEGGTVVACGAGEISELDNTDLALAKVWTRPEHRGRGLGSQMLAHVEAWVRGIGRTKVLAEIAFPYAGAPDGAGHRDVEFARRHGYTLALLDIQRVLRLPVADEILRAHAAEAAPHHEAYTLRSFTGAVPDDLVAGFAALDAALPTQAPAGELELEEARPDVAEFRAQEAVTAAQRRVRWATVALAADGSMAGYTEIFTSELEPGRAYQWGTLVWPEHRGARLGTALKVRNLQVLQRECPRVRRVYTWNAEVNAPMVGVNDLLGFEPVERLGEFKRVLPPS